jgi:hypothetical protein
MSSTSPDGVFSVHDALRPQPAPAGDNPQAKRNGDSLSAQIVGRLTVTDHLAGLGITVPPNRKVRCPLPDCDDSSPSFHVHPEGGWKCYQCERGGSVIDLHMLVEGLDRGDADDRRKAIHNLCDRLGITYIDTDRVTVLAEEAVNQPAAGADVATTWQPVDLADALAGRDIDPPTMFARSDGLTLVYPGRVHWFAGESESAKSWAAQLVAADELKAGRGVLYIDFEDDDRAVVARLRALGVPVDAIAALTYIRPDEPLCNRQGTPLAGWHALAAAVNARTYTLVIIDGVTEAMTVEGLELLDNADVARWLRLLPKRLAGTGAAVICIDHVAKADGGNGRYALGGQHKLAGVTGAAYKFAVVRPLARATGAEPVEAEIAVVVVKERPGYVRGRTSEGKVGALTFTAWPDGTVEAQLFPPGDSRPDPALVARIVDYLRTYDGSSQNAIVLGVEGKTGRVRAALQWMADGGLVTVEKKGQSHLHWLTDEGEKLR